MSCENILIIIFLLNIALFNFLKQNSARKILHENKQQCDNNVPIFCLVDFIQILDMLLIFWVPIKSNRLYLFY